MRLPKEILTIGYEGRTINEFIRILRRCKVSLVVDVREFPHSRKPGFAKTKLEISLRRAGIGYTHFKELGSPKVLRDQYRRDRDTRTFKTLYKKEVLARNGIVKQVASTIRGNVPCLLCYEANAMECHRSVVAEELKKHLPNGTHVRHL